MKRYLKVLGSLIRTNLSNILEYRGNFAAWITLEFFWAVWQVVMVEVFFSFTDSIAGWSKVEIFVLVGLFKIIKGLFDIFFYSNLLEFPEVINKGTFDFMLTKPIDSQFLTSFRTIWPVDIVEIVFGLAMIIYSFTHGLVFSLQSLLSGAIVSLCGVSLFYSLTLPVSLVVIFTQRFSALWVYHDVLKNLVRYPADIFSGHGRFFDFLLVPLSVLVTYPARALMGQGGWIVLVASLTISFSLLLATRHLWHFALRHYSSASS